MDCNKPGFLVFHYLLECALIHVHWISDVSKYFIFCFPVFLLTSIFPSIRIFSNELSVCIWWPKYQGFSFSISPSNEYSGLISFRIDWFDLVTVQATLNNLQHHNLKASILWHSVCFVVKLLHLYMTTGKTIALTILPFVSTVMSSLCFLMC